MEHAKPDEAPIKPAVCDIEGKDIPTPNAGPIIRVPLGDTIKLEPDKKIPFDL